MDPLRADERLRGSRDKNFGLHTDLFAEQFVVRRLLLPRNVYVVLQGQVHANVFA